jgi:hypothetical protein
MVTRSGGATGRWWVRARHCHTSVLVPCQLLRTLSVLSLPQELPRMSGRLRACALRTWPAVVEALQKQQRRCCTWGLTCVRGCWYDSGDARLRSLLDMPHAGAPVCVLCAGNCSLQPSSGLLGVVWYLCDVERVRSSPRATVTTASSPSAGQNASSPHPVCMSISAPR